MKLVWEDTVKERARAVVECWKEDLENTPDRVEMTSVQQRSLLHHIEVAVGAQRTEYQEVAP